MAPATPNNDLIQDSNQQLPSLNASNQLHIPRRSSQTQTTSPRTSSARIPSGRQADYAPTSPIVEDSRDSLSSNGSWIRRFSLRPLSQHESLRSSVGPDSPSITFSHGSTAPMLSSGHSPPQLPPNKLVKRASAINGGSAGPVVRRGSRTQMTLRRPATSHQRSATLHQQINAEVRPTLPEESFDQYHRPRAQTSASRIEPVLGVVTDVSSMWKSFWHSRLTRNATKPLPLKTNENSTSPGAKRICVEHHGRRRVYLVKPRTLAMGSSAAEAPIDIPPEQESQSNTEGSPQASDKSSVSAEDSPSKLPRRSISMHFSSPSNWITKSGSLRRRKRGDAIGGARRHASEPITANTQPISAVGSTDEGEGSKEEESNHAESELSAIFRPPTRKRNTSSPLPPISRLSTFHIDLSKLGSLSPDLHSQFDERAVSPTTVPRTVSNTSHTRTLERASTVASSDYHRGFMSGDDDDTDFKTDTPFDSFRTVASGRRRTLDSPLESMFDESPPSTGGNNTKPKRLSIQDILGPSFNGGNKIMEEDEGLSTPVRGGAYKDIEARFRAANLDENNFMSSPVSPNFTLQAEHPRFSLDDDDDDLDWGREDDSGIYNHLSPPGSMNSRRGSPNSRTALGPANGNRRPNARFDTASERPRSTVFDWAEPAAHEKHDGDGVYQRPKTVHGKQEIDIRGGRSASRKGPVPAHIRSQSVPIVPDQAEATNPTPKFGTWGLGQKNASEDWDDDFDFEEGGDLGPVAGENEDTRFEMVVPASIQATQPTIKAHSGQIRELSLLVNDLKRLCRLGREMDMFHESSTKLWREAEGIIALASPDDEDSTEVTDSKRDSSSTLVNSIDARFIDQGFDGASSDDQGSTRAVESQRNVVVRDRPAGRRRSVFSPEDDIFGTWDSSPIEETIPDRPRTPEDQLSSLECGSSSVARSVMEAMHSRQSRLSRENHEPSSGKLNFDTNSLKELVKRASDLRDGLSDIVRKADHLTQSPVRTPKHTRPDGSPAFTRVFDEPSLSPTRRIPNSHSNSSILSGNSVSTSPSNGLGQRMQMMTVS